MRTNFNRPTNLVVMDEDGEFMGLIRCEAGMQDITKRIADAISTSRMVEVQEIPKAILDRDYSNNFTIGVYDDLSEENYTIEVSITGITEY